MEHHSLIEMAGEALEFESFRYLFQLPGVNISSNRVLYFVTSGNWFNNHLFEFQIEMNDSDRNKIYKIKSKNRLTILRYWYENSFDKYDVLGEFLKSAVEAIKNIDRDLGISEDNCNFNADCFVDVLSFLVFEMGANISQFVSDDDDDANLLMLQSYCQNRVQVADAIISGMSIDSLKGLMVQYNLLPSMVRGLKGEGMLHIAARSNRADVIRWLVLDEKFDIHAKDRNFGTALSVAKIYKSMEVIDEINGLIGELKLRQMAQERHIGLVTVIQRFFRKSKAKIFFKNQRRTWNDRYGWWADIVKKLYNIEIHNWKNKEKTGRDDYNLTWAQHHKEFFGNMFF